MKYKTSSSLRRKTAYQDSVIISSFICLLIVLGFLQTSDRFLHWFLIPVTLCGILIGIDAVNWFRSRLNIFDPVGIFGLLGLHFFFLAPLLHVSWDMWLGRDTIPPPDWRPWVGGMAILNFLGLLVYRLSISPGIKPKKSSSVQTVWTINQQRFWPILWIAMILSACLQMLVYIKFGGISSYMQAATNINDMAAREEKFQGMGIVFLFSESFPILGMMGFAVHVQKNKREISWSILIGVFIIFLVLQMLFGGLRGSRSNTIWALFWAAGIVHFWIRHITKKQIAIGLVFICFFMYLYGFFKHAGMEGVETAFKGQEDRVELEQKAGRSWESMLLQDLGRTDIQAFLLYRLMRFDSDYEYAWGRTYLAALSVFIPSRLWPFDEMPANKSKEGTNAQYGMGSYAEGLWVSSRVYGLAGETMLNFGPFLIPFSFIVIGLFVRQVKRWLLNWNESDSRVLLLPLLVNLCFIILVSDLDNNLFILLKQGGFPFVVIWLGSHKKLVQNKALNFSDSSQKIT
ncbi:hypothetical protein ACE1B6_01110 [Aerosakkonemataceae cyanobacterium BLCC-F154]|uniref:O-antigen polysaccharide polymerase Wzy n=1 Tax=Floridaenema fluviatile BLCC-F154 TaxID=3153640 RepID=A0ABV4Y6F0_9CYAN